MYIASHSLVGKQVFTYVTSIVLYWGNTVLTKHGEQIKKKKL